MRLEKYKQSSGFKFKYVNYYHNRAVGKHIYEKKKVWVSFFGFELGQ